MPIRRKPAGNTLGTPTSPLPYVTVSECTGGNTGRWVETRYIARCGFPSYSTLAARLTDACAEARRPRPAERADIALLRSLPREVIDRLEAGDPETRTSLLSYLPYAGMWPTHGVNQYLRVIVHTMPREYWDTVRSAQPEFNAPVPASLVMGTAMPLAGTSRMLRLLYPLSDGTLSPTAVPETAELVQRGSVRLLDTGQRHCLGRITRAVAHDPRVASGLTNIEDISSSMVDGCLAGAALEYSRAVWGIPHRAL